MLLQGKNCSGSQSNKKKVNAYLDAFNSESWIAEFHFLFSSSTSTFRANCFANENYFICMLHKK